MVCPLLKLWKPRTYICSNLRCCFKLYRAKLALEEASRKVSALLTSEKQSGPAPLTLVFKGVSSFSDQVLFASLDKTNELMMSQFTAVAGEVLT